MSPLMAPRRLVITPLMRGPATRHSTTNRKANVIASQKIWLGKVVRLERRKAALLLGRFRRRCGGAGSAMLRLT